MHIQIKGQITIDTPAEKVWQIVAHDFEHIGNWASAIPTSFKNSDTPTIKDAPVEGRICTNSVAGFDDIQETFTHYNEEAMTFSYKATKGTPSFMQKAENNWAVQAIDANQCIVEARGEINVQVFPGLVIIPFLKWQMNRLSKQTMAELKYFAENDQPHPRKAKQIQSFKVASSQ